MGGWNISRKISEFAFELNGDDSTLEPFALQLYSGARRVHGGRDEEHSGDPAVRFRVSIRRGIFTFSREEEKLCHGSDLASFFRKAEWAVTKAAINGLGRYFQLHAGAVTTPDGRARLIVGPPDSGKTSLVLACAEMGAGILSDEIALIDADELTVAPFLQDLVVHNGTSALFSDFLDRADAPPWKRFPSYRFVAPSAVSELPTGRARITQLIFPFRRQGESTAVERVGQAAAAEMLLAQSFNLRNWGARGVDVMAQLVERAAAYSVCFDDARAAARCLPGLEIQS